MWRALFRGIRVSAAQVVRVLASRRSWIRGFRAGKMQASQKPGRPPLPRLPYHRERLRCPSGGIPRDPLTDHIRATLHRITLLYQVLRCKTCPSWRPTTQMRQLMSPVPSPQKSASIHSLHHPLRQSSKTPSPLSSEVVISKDEHRGGTLHTNYPSTSAPLLMACL